MTAQRPRNCIEIESKSPDRRCVAPCFEVATDESRCRAKICERTRFGRLQQNLVIADGRSKPKSEQPIPACQSSLDAQLPIASSSSAAPLSC